jgi:hypothetical protein
MPKKGTRRVHVHDKAYRYLFKCYGGEEPHVSVFVQEDCDEPGNVLQINLDRVNIEDSSLPDFSNGCDCGHHNDVIGRYGLGPGDIAELIKLSQIAGWEPSKKGPAVRFEKDFIIDRDKRK